MLFARKGGLAHPYFLYENDSLQHRLSYDLRQMTKFKDVEVHFFQPTSQFFLRSRFRIWVRVRFLDDTVNEYRSRQQRCSVKKGVRRNFAKFMGKHLCQSLFYNEVAGLWPKACNFIKKEALAQVFSCEFCEISKNTFSTEHLQTNASVSNHTLGNKTSFW